MFAVFQNVLIRRSAAEALFLMANQPEHVTENHNPTSAEI
jgi:hypothetical protein